MATQEAYKRLRKKGRLIPKLEQRAMLSKRKAEYLASPKGLARETIKGIPEATKKVGRKLLEYSPLGLAAKGIGKGFSVPKTEEEAEERRKRLERIQELVEEYKKKFPKFKVPKEFQY